MFRIPMHIKESLLTQNSQRRKYIKIIQFTYDILYVRNYTMISLRMTPIETINIF